jgi:hypothetical protein
MAKIIAVCGATGGMGGAVADRMLKETGWKVRAVTRDTQSEKAQSLKSRGAEVVLATYDDIDLLVQAFEVSCPVNPILCLRLTQYTGRHSNLRNHKLLAPHRHPRQHRCQPQGDRRNPQHCQRSGSSSHASTLHPSRPSSRREGSWQRVLRPPHGLQRPCRR